MGWEEQVGGSLAKKLKWSSSTECGLHVQVRVQILVVVYKSASNANNS